MPWETSLDRDSAAFWELAKESGPVLLDLAAQCQASADCSRNPDICRQWLELADAYRKLAVQSALHARIAAAVATVMVPVVLRKAG